MTENVFESEKGDVYVLKQKIDYVPTKDKRSRKHLKIWEISKNGEFFKWTYSKKDANKAVKEDMSKS